MAEVEVGAAVIGTPDVLVSAVEEEIADIPTVFVVPSAVADALDDTQPRSLLDAPAPAGVNAGDSSTIFDAIADDQGASDGSVVADTDPEKPTGSSDATAESASADGDDGNDDDGNDDDDDDSDDAPHVFEGPEKCLEVDFCVGSGPENGLFHISRATWDSLLASCGCEIISVRSNEELKSYVLSESSLFVFHWKLVLKTCGKTTPLHAIPHLQAMCKEHNFEMEWMGFSRKNYSFPVLQVHPHTNFSDEVRYIQDKVHRGEGHILGPLTGDHWYLYVAELTNNYTHPQTDFKMDIMMYGLDPRAAEMFFNPDGTNTAEKVRAKMQFEKYFVGAQVHDVLFEPCGYSLNAFRGDTYYTMHVTPEPEFSYASFETNLDAASYEALVQYVLGIFRPKRFTITVFYDVDEDAAADGMMRVHTTRRNNPLDQNLYSAAPDSTLRYRRCLKTESQFLGEFVGGIGNWKLVHDVTQRKPKTRAVARGNGAQTLATAAPPPP